MSLFAKIKSAFFWYKQRKAREKEEAAERAIEKAKEQGWNFDFAGFQKKWQSAMHERYYRLPQFLIPSPDKRRMMIYYRQDEMRMGWTFGGVALLKEPQDKPQLFLLEIQASFRVQWLDERYVFFMYSRGSDMGPAFALIDTQEIKQAIVPYEQGFFYVDKLENGCLRGHTEYNSKKKESLEYDLQSLDWKYCDLLDPDKVFESLLTGDDWFAGRRLPSLNK